MKMMHAAALTAALALAAGAAQAEVVPRAVTGLPEATPVSAGFLEYVKRVNEAGEGVVQFDYMGGPEVTPPMRQAAALERGLVDVIHVPAAFYAGQVKEIDALLAANRPMSEIRENGGLDLLNKLWGEQLNARVVTWFDSSVSFHLYLKKMPEITEDSVSFEGMKLYATSTYRDFEEALGATPVSIGTGEILTALERGLIDGYGWPDYALVAMGFGRETKYRIDPPFFGGNGPVLINADVWEDLPQDAKDLLTEVAIEWEAEAPDFIAAIKAEEKEQLTAMGMEIVELPPEAADFYLDAAYNALWERLDATGSADARPLAELLHDPDRL